MATLLNAVTTDTETETGQSHSGPATVFIEGDLKGGTVHILMGRSSGGVFVPTPKLGQVRSTGTVNVDAYGTYFLKARLVGAGPGAVVTAITTQ